MVDWLHAKGIAMSGVGQKGRAAVDLKQDVFGIAVVVVVAVVVDFRYCRENDGGERHGFDSAVARYVLQVRRRYGWVEGCDDGCQDQAG